MFQQTFQEVKIKFTLRTSFEKRVENRDRVVSHSRVRRAGVPNIKTSNKFTRDNYQPIVPRQELSMSFRS